MVSCNSCFDALCVKLWISKRKCHPLTVLREDQYLLVSCLVTIVQFSLEKSIVYLAFTINVIWWTLSVGEIVPIHLWLIVHLSCGDRLYLPVEILQSACTSMCRHIYDWNIVNCDVKQPIQLNSTQENMSSRRFWLSNAVMGNIALMSSSVFDLKANSSQFILHNTLLSRGHSNRLDVNTVHSISM